MLTLSFYRIRTCRPETLDGAAGEALSRESYGSRERPDCTLFLWRDPDGEPRMLQFLFGERFIEWSDGSAWIAGDTNRHGQEAGTPGHGKGVRTLQGRRAAADDAVLAEGLALLAGAELPAELRPILPALLPRSGPRGDAREH
ncbi:MAG: hypothetical protein V2J24_06075 [Pseudomonadales bacterium]|nr:hypothetical protein [Pseudomonadales bacterium]